MKKFLIITLAALLVVSLYASDSTLVIQAGPSGSVNAIRFDDAASVLVCAGGRASIAAPLAAGYDFFSSLKVEYGTSVYDYSQWVRIPDCVLSSITSGVDFRFGSFSVIPQAGFKILDFLGSESNRYLMAQVGVSGKYSRAISNKVNMSIIVPVEYAVSANGSSISVGVSFIFGGVCSKEGSK